MTDSNRKIVTRFAPSPTGHLHIGGVRTALFSYFFARKNNGKFIIRIEDTDKERSKKEYEDSILDSFGWLDIDYDELHRQSENIESYKKYLHELVDNGLAYISKEEPKEKGDRDSVIRFKNPNKVVSFTDEILGEISVDSSDLKDFVIAKDFDTPVFHFANVVDDHEMGVTHIIRAQEHVPNTPRQILIREALDLGSVVYAHIPLILSESKKKMSKRDGDTNVYQYKENGYLPEALINFLVLIGWNPGTDQEIFTRQELIKEFDLKKVQKSPGVFNEEKLDWFNKEYLNKLSFEEQEEYVSNFIPESLKNLPSYNSEMLHNITPTIIERISKGSDIVDMANAGELTYFFGKPVYEKESLIFKSSKIKDNNKYLVVASYLKHVVELIESIADTDFNKNSVKNTIWPYAEKVGRGDLLWPMRYAMTGQDKSPDPFLLSEILGKKETVERLNTAIGLLLN